MTGPTMVPAGPSDDPRSSPLGTRRDQRLLWVTPERVLYAGLLGAPSVRSLGALTVYAALDAPLRLRTGAGPWVDGELAVMPPYEPHEVACQARHVLVFSVEPETVDGPALPPPLRGARGVVPAPELLARLHRAHAALLSREVGAATTTEVDRLVFGRPLPARALDARIAFVLAALRRDPASDASAADLAARVGLSTSRFLHLFKSEVGTPLRRWRSWTRARSLLRHVRREVSLVHVALDAGYPDASHFSHSIRQVYGLKPRDIVAGSRRLRLIAEATGDG